jgi:hypothetical protein
MIRKEDENVVIFGGLKDTSTANIMDSRLVALKNVKKDFRFNCKSFIIDNNTLIDINSWVGKSRLIENFAFERVLDVVGNIIVGEGDNLVLRETVLFENVIGVVDVGLVTVVGVCIGAGDEDSPIVA